MKKLVLKNEKVAEALVAFLNAKAFKKEHCYFAAKLANGVSKYGWELTQKQIEASKKLLEEHYASQLNLFLEGKALQQDANYIAPAPKEPKAPKAKPTQKPKASEDLSDVLKSLESISKTLAKLESRIGKLEGK